MNHSLLSINTIFTNLIRVALAVLVIATVFLITQNIVSAQSTGENPCTGGTQIIVDETGTVFCRDAQGNVCEPGNLVEGNSAGTLRCPTFSSGSLEDQAPDLNQGGQFTCNGVSTSIEVVCEAGVNPIYSYVTAIVNFIAAGVGIAIVANVMIGGVQYMTSRGNPQNTQAAISRITNAFIALFAFIFLWAFFNWLIPTGIL